MQQIKLVKSKKFKVGSLNLASLVIHVCELSFRLGLFFFFEP